MYESRCGVGCDSCERKELVGCKGCLQMKAPFWGGDCMVKICCEERGLNHCGECGEFPCEMLSNMGKDQGFDPEPKLRNLRLWASQEAVTKENE